MSSEPAFANRSIPTAVRAFTWHDLVVCAALATPPTAGLILGLLSLISGIAGGPAVEVPAGPAMFFVNLAGLFGVLWNIAMLSESQPRLHRVDLMARACVISLIVFHVVWSGLPRVFALFVLTELSGGLAKLLWLRTKA
ncbi:MAG TPA: hypothetical protein PKN09_13830 [Novosphingobium sp.]|nr:hypothetical protein [Novosphingobium sp.]